MNKVFKCEIKNLNIYNLLASLALLNVFNLNIKNITKHLKKYEPTEGRGKIHNVKRFNKNFNVKTWLLPEVDNKIIGYVGAISNAIDFDLLEYIKSFFEKYFN